MHELNEILEDQISWYKEYCLADSLEIEHELVDEFPSIGMQTFLMLMEEITGLEKKY